MTFKRLLQCLGAMTLPAAAWLAGGLPAFYLVTHGLDPSTWPAEAVIPQSWIWRLSTLDVPFVWNMYGQVLAGQSPALPGGGHIHGLLWAGSCIAAAVSLLPFSAAPDRRRDRSGQLGDARWADHKEKARMRRGIELGIDPETNKPIRIAVESNLFSVSPPRTGKTSGHIIPNLLVADERAWNGPVVVIDPKGEVFRVTARRRRQLGRRVIRFDLRRGAKNSQRWNPLAGLHPRDVERLQNIARSLVTQEANENKYFSDRGIDVFAGAIAAAIVEARATEREPTPADVARLLSDPAALLAIAQSQTSQIFRSIVNDLLLDERARDQLLSTAKTGVSWLADARFQRLTANGTFSMSEVARGEVDLFIIVPPESTKLLAPLLRWMLADLISKAGTVRTPGDERLLVIIDEAAALGRFEELEQAVGLLPGLGVSFWTFWQSRAQVQERYGANGLAVFTDTAEVITVSDFSRLGNEAEVASRAIDNFTTLVESTSTQMSSAGQSSGIGVAKQATPLMTADALKAMSPNELVVLLNSKRYGKHPLCVRKTRYFDDDRFIGLHDGEPPTKAL